MEEYSVYVYIIVGVLLSVAVVSGVVIGFEVDDREESPSVIYQECPSIDVTDEIPPDNTPRKYTVCTTKI